MPRPLNKKDSYGYKDEDGKIVETFRTKFAAQGMKKQYEAMKWIKVDIIDLREKDGSECSKMRKRAKPLPSCDPKYDIHGKD